MATRTLKNLAAQWLAWGYRRGWGLRALWHGTFAKNRKVIKVTGVANIAGNIRFYPSPYHFQNNIPSFLPLRKYDYLVAQSFADEEFLSCTKPKVFFTREPIPYYVPGSRTNIESEQVTPFFYSFGDPEIAKRMFYAVFYGGRKRILKRLERSLRERREKLCCIVNRYAENPTCNLLQKRIEFVAAFGTDIDIYGAEPHDGKPNAWKDLPNHRGPTRNKLKTLRRYTFVLAFENSNSNGYITEKIIHAFMAGSIPLYWGGGEYLSESIPAACYINCKGRSPDEILQRIKTMPDEEIVAYRRAALAFLNSEAAERFTHRYFADGVIRRLESEEANRFRQISREICEIKPK